MNFRILNDSFHNFFPSTVTYQCVEIAQLLKDKIIMYSSLFKPLHDGEGGGVVALQLNQGPLSRKQLNNETRHWIKNSRFVNFRIIDDFFHIYLVLTVINRLQEVSVPVSSLNLSFNSLDEDIWNATNVD